MTRRDGKDVWSREEIASPCVRICVLHPDEKICIGCYRTAQEIGQWITMEVGGDEDHSSSSETVIVR